MKRTAILALPALILVGCSGGEADEPQAAATSATPTLSLLGNAASDLCDEYCDYLDSWPALADCLPGESTGIQCGMPMARASDTLTDIAAGLTAADGTWEQELDLLSVGINQGQQAYDAFTAPGGGCSALIPETEYLNTPAEVEACQGATSDMSTTLPQVAELLRQAGTA